VFQRLAAATVFAHWHIIAGRTLREVQFLAPVHADTHLHGSLTVTAVSKGQHRWGLVTTSGTLEAGDTKPALSLEMAAYVRRRPTAC
jgi:acyl dehydratase